MQTLLAQAADAPMVAVEQQPPPKGEEYVHSMMYWLAVKNHLLMIQSRSLGSKQLEEYLSWLVKDLAGAVGETGHVILKEGSRKAIDPQEEEQHKDDGRWLRPLKLPDHLSLRANVSACCSLSSVTQIAQFPAWFR
jgi:hypothetical protein